MKEAVRNIPGVPLIIISHNSINLEKPSNTNIEKVDESVSSKMMPKEDELTRIKRLKEKLECEKQANSKPVFRKRKPKGPNPLSCKKTKKNNKNQVKRLNNNNNPKMDKKK